VLLGHDAVDDVAIIGYADDRLGSRIAAVVVSSTGVDLQSLRARCEDVGLAKAKWPEYLAMIDKIPLSAIGKVRRDELETFVEQHIKNHA